MYSESTKEKTLTVIHINTHGKGLKNFLDDKINNNTQHKRE